jgi:general secretion pathway protein H
LLRTCFASQRRSKGFTLIELLVTIVIISVLISLAVLSIGDTQAERERRLITKLATLTELARETALFNSQELALFFWEHGYAFYRLDDERWQLITEDTLLRNRELPEDIIISLHLEGLQVELPAELDIEKESDDKDEDEPGAEPQVFILSSGEVTPFEVRIGDGRDSEMELVCDELGNITVNQRET